MRQKTSNALARSSTPRGFTLLELVILIGILALMAGLGLDLLIRSKEQSAFRVTSERMEKLRQAVLLYSKDTVQCRLGQSSGLLPDSGILNAEGFASLDEPEIRYQNPLHLGSTPQNCSRPPYLPYTEGPEGTLPKHAIDDLYFDGWGTPLYYLGPSRSYTSVNQAIAYLVSAGPDREKTYRYGVSGSEGDDLVFEINAVQIFHDEARKRVDEIETAIRTYRNLINGDALMDLSPSPSYEALLQVLVRDSKFLPEDFRYRFSPWRISGALDVETFLLLGENPVGFIGYVAPRTFAIEGGG